MRRVLIVTILGCVALFAVWWIREPGAVRISIDVPSTPTVTATIEPELVTVEPVGARGVSSVAEPVVTEIDAVVPTLASATTGTGLRLFGTVRLDGVSLEPVEVSCTNGLGFQRGMRVDKRSQYSFDGLAPGLYWLRAGSNETNISRARVDLQADMRLDLALELPRQVAVHVLDEHGVTWAPPGVAAIATESEPGRRFDADSSSPWASVRRPRFAPADEARPVFATLVLPSRSPAYVSLVQHETVVATRFVAPTETEVGFRIARDELGPSAGTVSFRLVDVVNRAPLRRATVQISGEYMAHLACPEGEGRATLPPGPWTLRFFSGELGTLERDFRVEPGVDLDLGDLVVGHGCVLRGRVVDDKGQGHGAFIECNPCDEHGVTVRRGLSKFLVSTAADGSFELRGVPPGHHRLEASGGQARPRGANRGLATEVDTEFDFDPALCARVIEVRTEDVNGIVLAMRPGIAVVVRPSGREKGGAGFRVITTEGLVLASGGLSPHDPQRILLAPGSYDVETWTERDGPRERTPIEVVRDMVVIDVR